MQLKYIIVHHSGGTDANPLADSSNYTVAECNADHKIRFNMLSSLGYYVGYTYFIDKQGVVTQCRKDGEEGAHTVGHNSDSIGICLAGNFDATLPTQVQTDSLKKLMISKMQAFGIQPADIIPHRHFAVKTCYGNKLADDWAAKLIAGVPTMQPSITYSIIALGDKGQAVSNFQAYLVKSGFAQNPFVSGVYDENMAKNVLAFQIANKVSDAIELGEVRGERVGAKTLAAIK